RHHVGHRKRWERAGVHFDHPRRGAVVGLRTRQNVWTRSGNYDEPAEWRQETTVPAYLVAFDLRTKPVPVHPDHLEEVESLPTIPHAPRPNGSPDWTTYSPAMTPKRTTASDS